MLSEIWIYKKNEKIFLVTLFLLLVVIGCLNWMLGLLTAIVIIGFVIVIEKNDYKQERILLNYLDELSAGVEAGTIYAVKNLPLGISLMDEKRQFVWANGVFRSWLKADIEEDNLFKDVFSGVRISKIWGKTGWFDYSLDEEYYRQILTYLKRSGSDQTVALNSDVLVNIDLNQVFHLHNTTEQKVTVVYKKLPKELISDVNSILEID